jgi:hypothetical protein
MQVAMVSPIVKSGEFSVKQESGVRRSVLCWRVSQNSGFSHREDFSFNLLYKDGL